MSITINQFGSGNGLIVESGNKECISSWGGQYPLLDTLKDCGFIVMRGFDSNADSFNTLVKDHSSRITLDPARVFKGDNAQKVDSGTGEIGLHTENGATPFRPDLVWFYCEKAASVGSETTVCDGQTVWKNLPEDLQKFYDGRPIEYSRTIPEKLWKRYVAHSINKDAETVTPGDVEELISSNVDASFVVNQDGSLTYTFCEPAVHPSYWSQKPSWANSIFGPSYNYDVPTMSFTDGGELDSDILAQTKEVTDAVTEDIAWQDGDIVLIDNTRVMHGRRKIVDSRRSIFNAQSFV